MPRLECICIVHVVKVITDVVIIYSLLISVVKPAYEVLAGVIPAVQEKVLPVIESNLEFWSKEKESEAISGRTSAEEAV